MTKQEAIELAIAKATAAEADTVYYEKVKQTDAYQAGGPFARAIDAQLAALWVEVAFQQTIKAALVNLPE